MPHIIAFFLFLLPLIIFMFTSLLPTVFSKLFFKSDSQFYASAWLGHGNVRVYHDETSLLIGGLSKGDCLLQCGWALFNLLRTWVEKIAEEGRFVPSLPACWAGTSVFSYPWIGIYTISNPGSQAFGLSCNLHHRLAFQGLRLADGRSWDFSANHTSDI